MEWNLYFRSVSIDDLVILLNVILSFLTVTRGPLFWKSWEGIVGKLQVTNLSAKKQIEHILPPLHISFATCVCVPMLGVSVHISVCVCVCVCVLVCVCVCPGT